MKLNTHYLTDAHRVSAVDWRENHLGESLFYSSRSTVYDRASYPSTMHYHDYYELVVFVEGDIRYLCEDERIAPRTGDIILIPPGRLHMSMLEGDATLYRRHVFYLYPDALAPWGADPLVDFLHEPGSIHLTLPAPDRDALLTLLDRLDAALSGAPSSREHALAPGLAMEAFYLIGSARPALVAPDEAGLPEAVVEIRRYLDAHFTELSSVSDLADRLFYRREHIARLFRRYFNTTVSDYLRTRRVAYARSLIAAGAPLTDACFHAGFTSMSTFIRAFRTVTGMTPSEVGRRS